MSCSEYTQHSGNRRRAGRVLQGQLSPQDQRTLLRKSILPDRPQLQLVDSAAEELDSPSWMASHVVATPDRAGHPAKGGLSWSGFSAMLKNSQAEQAKNPRKSFPMPLKKVAAVVTEYRKWSHADVILRNLLNGYPDGKRPELELVSLYTDQLPKGDMSRDL